MITNQKIEEQTYGLLYAIESSNMSVSTGYRHIQTQAPNEKVKLLAMCLVFHKVLLRSLQNTKAEESLVLVIINLTTHAEEPENDAMYIINIEFLCPVITEFLEKEDGRL